MDQRTCSSASRGNLRAAADVGQGEQLGIFLFYGDSGTRQGGELTKG